MLAYIKKAVLLGLIALPLLPLYVRAAADTSKTLEAKLALEGSLEKRLRSLLTEILGTDNIVVAVDVDLRSEEEKASDDEVMPGVPNKESQIDPAFLNSTMTLVRRIHAEIIVDQSTSDSDIQLIRKVTGNLLGISPDRQDAISVERMSFKKPAAAAETVFTPERVLRGAWLVVALLAVGLLYWGFLGRFLKVCGELVQAMRTHADAAASTAMTMPLPGTTAALAAAESASSANGSRDMKGSGHPGKPESPFSFLRQEQMPRLIHLMRKESLEQCAILLQYLPPKMASELLEAFNNEARQNIAQHLAVVTEIDDRKVRALEDKIRTRIEFVVGGEQRLADILNSAAPEVQDDFLGRIAERDPGLRGRLERQIVRLDDLEYFHGRDLQLLWRRIPAASLAQVLRSRPEIAQRVGQLLPSGLGAWLSEEISMSRELPPDQKREEMMRVLDAMRTLVREGQIVIARNGNGNGNGGKAEGSANAQVASQDPGGKPA